MNFRLRPSFVFKANYVAIVGCVALSCFWMLACYLDKAAASIILFLFSILLYFAGQRFIAFEQIQQIQIDAEGFLMATFPEKLISGKIKRFVHCTNIVLILDVQCDQWRSETVFIFADALSNRAFCILSAWCHAQK